MTTSRPVFHSIPARIMTVTAIIAWVVDPDGNRHTDKLGWRAECYQCRKLQTFMLHQHAKAIAYTRLHNCYGKDRTS